MRSTQTLDKCFGNAYKAVCRPALGKSEQYHPPTAEITTEDYM